MMTNKPRWIAHVTDGMPARLKPDTLVNVACFAFLNGKTVIHVFPSSTWALNWSRRSGIVAYQILEETK